MVTFPKDCYNFVTKSSYALFSMHFFIPIKSALINIIITIWLIILSLATTLIQVTYTTR